MTAQYSPSLEAKIVVLGAQGVGKTSLVNRFISPSTPLSPVGSQIPSTIGAAFFTKRVTDPDTSTAVRLQIWDTAGQERFRSISRLYYRGANAGLLCYDITDEKSWEDMKGWLREFKSQCGDGEDVVIHVVGTKSDIVAEDPSKRKVPFERTIAYVAEQLFPSQASTPPVLSSTGASAAASAGLTGLQSPDSKRSSGFWGQDVGWDSCHEVNARDGEGIEEVFRVIARKLVEQRNRKLEREAAMTPYTGQASGTAEGDYFTGSHNSTGHHGSFRLGIGDKRRSWLGLPSVGLGIGEDHSAPGEGNQGRLGVEEARKKGKCC